MAKETPATLMSYFNDIKRLGDQIRLIANDDLKKEDLLHEYRCGKEEYRRRKEALEAQLKSGQSTMSDCTFTSIIYS